MSNLTHAGIFVFRITISLFMLFGHGLGKFNRLISGKEIKFFDPFGLGETVSFVFAVSSEFIAAGLIIIGLFTRLSSLALIITMFVAGIIFHFDDPFSSKEKALMYLVSYFLIFVTGPGKYSLQALLKNKITVQNTFAKFIIS